MEPNATNLNATNLNTLNDDTSSNLTAGDYVAPPKPFPLRFDEPGSTFSDIANDEYLIRHRNRHLLDGIEKRGTGIVYNDKFKRLDFDYNNIDSVDNYINSLNDEYNKLTDYMSTYEKRRADLENSERRNRPHWTEWWRGADQYAYNKQRHKQHYDRLIADMETEKENNAKKRDMLYGLIKQAGAQKAQMLANIETNKQKYTAEREALAKIGIKNPYFLVKSGLISNSASPAVNLSGSSGFSGATNLDYQRFAYEKDKDSRAFKLQMAQFIIQTLMSVANMGMKAAGKP